MAPTIHKQREALGTARAVPSLPQVHGNLRACTCTWETTGTLILMLKEAAGHKEKATASAAGIRARRARNVPGKPQ